MTKKEGKKNSWSKYFGPGLITGASDDDPSGIVTYTQSGAKFGFNQLWLMLLDLPMLIAVQEAAGRVGLVTGRGLVSVIKDQYGKWLVGLFVGLILIANVINIGADLGAMADAFSMLYNPIPPWVYMLFIAFWCVLATILIDYKRYANFLKFLTISLFCYVITLFIVNKDWWNLLVEVITPRIIWTKEFFMLMIGVMGTTISPYLLVWQANEEVEEQIKDGKSSLSQRIGATVREVKEMRIDTMVGMFYAQAVAFCIVASSAIVFYKNGVTQIDTVSQAATVLKPLAGDEASLLYAIGVIGTGLLAVPVLASVVAYAFAEVWGVSEGLSKKFNQAKIFYLVMAVSVFIGLGLNILRIDSVKTLVWAAVVNGVLIVPLLIFLYKVSSNKSIMGRWTNGWLENTMLLFTIVVMGVASVLMFVLN